MCLFPVLVAAWPHCSCDHWDLIRLLLKSLFLSLFRPHSFHGQVVVTKRNKSKKDFVQSQRLQRPESNINVSTETSGGAEEACLFFGSMLMNMVVFESSGFNFFLLTIAQRMRHSGCWAWSFVCGDRPVRGARRAGGLEHERV